MFTRSETVNCSEILKLNLNPEIHLRLLFKFNELQTKAGSHFFNSLQLQWNSPYQYFSVYCNPVFENTTSAGKDQMLVMVFSAQLEENFLS